MMSDVNVRNTEVPSKLPLTSKALVTSSDALVPSSFLFLIASCFY